MLKNIFNRCVLKSPQSQPYRGAEHTKCLLRSASLFTSGSKYTINFGTFT